MVSLDVVPKLAGQLRQLAHCLVPTREEATAIQRLVQRVQDCLGHGTFHVSLFGSHTLGLATPDSDVDICVRCPPHHEGDIAVKLVQAFRLMEITALTHTRVKLLRFCDTVSHYRVDIAINPPDVRESYHRLLRALAQHNGTVPTILVLKLLLRGRDLLNTHTGGMSAYALYNLVAAFARWRALHVRVQVPAYETGFLFLDTVAFLAQPRQDHTWWLQTGVPVWNGGDRFSVRCPVRPEVDLLFYCTKTEAIRELCQGVLTSVRQIRAAVTSSSPLHIVLGADMWCLAQCAGRRHALTAYHDQLDRASQNKKDGNVVKKHHKATQA